jgi:hypothetical protein
MKPRGRRLFLALMLPFAAAFAEPGEPFSEESFRFVRDGRAFGEIHIPRDACEEEKTSAAYLQKWIREVTGVRVEISTNATGAGIFLKASRDVADSRSGDGTFRIRALRRDTVALEGGEPGSLRMATARLVEKTLGVNFLMPGEFGADWRRRRMMELPDRDEVVRPSFRWRQLTGMNTPAEREWALDNGLGGLPAMNHALWDVFDAKAFAENPAMFPTLGGKLTGPSGRGGYEPQPNLANPDSAKYAAKRAWEFFQKNPGAPAFSLSINDNMTWDESPESKVALGHGKYFRNRPDYSDYVFGFMNRASKALYDEETEAIRRDVDKNWTQRTTGVVEQQSGTIFGLGGYSIGCFVFPMRAIRPLTAYAYYHCENTPSFPVEPGVFPILTADRSEWRDPSFAAEDAALMERWSKSGVRNFGIYDYYYGINMAVPRIFFRAQAESVKHAANAGASLFYAELEPDWGFDGPKAWLAAKLAWNPKTDAEDVLETYFDSAYGPAASAMRRFYGIAESRWTHRGQPPRWIRFFREESVAELFPASVISEMRAALNMAEGEFPSACPELARDGGQMERQRLRVRTTSVSFAKVEAFVARYAAMKHLAELPEATDDAGVERIRHALTACASADAGYHAAVKRWNSAALNPGAPFDPGIYWSSNPVTFASAKCANRWKSLRSDDPVPLMAAACLAEKPPAGVETVLNETFESDSFRPPTAGGWSERKGLTIPKSPWRINLFEAEHTRFGYSIERATSGKGSLIVAGGDLAKLTRSVPVFTGDIVAVKLRHSGKIIPGVHVGLSVSFSDATGRVIAGGSQSVAFPCEDTGWRSLAAFGAAPEGAEKTEVVLHIMNQEASDALWVDDLVIRRYAPGEPLE